MPAAPQFVLQRHATVPLSQITDHGVDRSKCPCAVFGRLRLKQQPVMRHWSGLDQMFSCLGREGGQASLHHQMRNIKIHRCFGYDAIFDTMEISVAQHDNLAGRLDTEPWRIKQPHEVSHGYDPPATM